jgi:apolipoprotein D and lipocalin family protein
MKHYLQNKGKVLSLIISILLTATSCSFFKGLLKPEAAGLKAYEGKWYVIASLPNRFEEGLVCSTSVFKYNEDRTLTVTNSARDKSTGRVKSFTVKAWNPDKNSPELFRVQIFFTMTRDFRLVYVSEDNSSAIIGSESKHLMWILSRAPSTDDETLTMLIEKAAGSGYDTRRIIMIEQSCGD